MNIKIALLGGLTFYAVQFIVSMGTGTFLHEGILEPLYMANSEFWRPELNQVPPDMAALMPRWISVGIVISILMAGIYSIVRSSFTGTPWLKGVKYGLMLTVLMTCWSAAWSGIFNLPDVIWFWWTAESLLYYVIGGAALGFVAEKLAPESS